MNTALNTHLFSGSRFFSCKSLAYKWLVKDSPSNLPCTSRCNFHMNRSGLPKCPLQNMPYLLAVILRCLMSGRHPRRGLYCILQNQYTKQLCCSVLCLCGCAGQRADCTLACSALSWPVQTPEMFSNIYAHRRKQQSVLVSGIRVTGRPPKSMSLGFGFTYVLLFQNGFKMGSDLGLYK